MVSARLQQQWALILGADQYKIHYRAGKDNANVDTLAGMSIKSNTSRRDSAVDGNTLSITSEL